MRQSEALSLGVLQARAVEVPSNFNRGPRKQKQKSLLCESIWMYREADQAAHQREKRRLREWISRIATSPFPPALPLSLSLRFGYLLSPFVFPQLFCFARNVLGEEEDVSLSQMI